MPLVVSLPPELERFVQDAIADGSWASADDLFAYALSLARTASVLGKPMNPTPPPRVDAPSSPQPTFAQVEKSQLKSTIVATPVVDTTRHSFDSSRFMSELTKRLHGDRK